MEVKPVPWLDALVDRLRSHAVNSSHRQIVGFAGAPGSGKSTVAAIVARELGAELCAAVPMDGFHLAGDVLRGTPLMERKGAIDTFDAGGYVALLTRLKAREESVVYAPSYRRGLEEPIAASIAIPRSIPIVVTEGNYLLAEEKPWDGVRKHLDEVWYVEVTPALRRRRLIDRHVSFGMAPDVAAAWAHGPDENNAQFIESTKHRADGVLEWH